jgi:ribosomal protein S18 acetylase RimI-like enzyme
MSIEIRKASADDLKLLTEWRMRVLHEVFSTPDDADMEDLRAANEAYYREHVPDGTHTACFAVDTGNGRIVGCGGICYQHEMPSPDNPTGTCGYLMNIFAVPELRGRGIGRKVVEFLIADARARGIGKIYLESSQMAKSLYRSIGFEDLPDYMKL